MKEVKISPIFYMGNKKKLIKKGLVELFQEQINVMVDLFGGSGVVSMNTKANTYYIGDKDENLVSLYNLFKHKDSDTIVNHIYKRVEEFELSKERTRRCDFIGKEDVIEKYKKAYMNFRKFYNGNKNILDFYTLMFYSFSQQFRFNKNGEFNMAFGTDCFSEKNEEYIKNGCEFFSKDNVFVGKNDFRNLNIELLCENDFVYLDPPYLITCASYNENGGWTEKDEDDLYSLCEQLNERGIKFGLSNVFINKNKENTKLIDWCERKGWNVYVFDKVSYSACGKGNSNAKEVFITNY